MRAQRRLWIPLAAAAVAVIAVFAIAVPRIRHPHNVGGHNADWRRDRTSSPAP